MKIKPSEKSKIKNWLIPKSQGKIIQKNDKFFKETKKDYFPNKDLLIKKNNQDLIKPKDSPLNITLLIQEEKIDLISWIKERIYILDENEKLTKDDIAGEQIDKILQALAIIKKKYLNFFQGIKNLENNLTITLVPEKWGKKYDLGNIDKEHYIGGIYKIGEKKIFLTLDFNSATAFHELIHSADDGLREDEQAESKNFTDDHEIQAKIKNLMQGSQKFLNEIKTQAKESWELESLLFDEIWWCRKNENAEIILSSIFDAPREYLAHALTALNTDRARIMKKYDPELYKFLAEEFPKLK
ncbi:MAG: hypothetical protein HYU63_05755 [Armatimonadetes bacterium]|nr:hypothetical protein [Armatimonadota bacterium]